MSVKIINVLKNDSFNDILELFQQSTAAEVILVLPRVGKLFRHEDHFAAFASEAQQRSKVVSVLTSNPQTALLARKFGFTVMASGTSKTAKTAQTAPTLATAPPPGDFSIPDFDDGADLGDVPLTSDQTQGTDSEDAPEDDPLRNMHIEDEKGNIVDENEDGVPDRPTEEDFTATLAAAPKTIDGLRKGVAPRTLSPSTRSQRAMPVPIQRSGFPDESLAMAGSDYIDTVWRGMKGRAVSGSATPGATARVARSGSLSKRVALVMVGAAVLVLAGVVYLTTGSAHVMVVPVSEIVDTQMTVQASDVVTTIDDAFAKIPGQLIEVSKTAEHTVAASGTRDVASKARGKITVYNEYSSTPQTLITNTRFGASDGKIFRTLQTITVPGSTTSAGKTIAGKTTVDVIADAPGATYNIPAGRFIIIAFKEKGDTSKLENFYGVSEHAMSGGASGPSAVITQDDYDKAKHAATTAVREQISIALQAQGADLQVLGTDASVVVDITSTARPDDAADHVTVSATGALTTVAFRTQDLHAVIAGTILKKERLVVLPDQLTIAYTDIVLKPDLGTLAFTVTLKGKGYLPIDTDAIAQDIVGKNSANIRAYFQDREGVESATVTLSPFWVRSVPKNTAKIRIELVYPTPTSENR